MTKVLKVILFILIILTLVESVYYLKTVVFNDSAKKLTSGSNVKVITETRITNTPALSLSISTDLVSLRNMISAQNYSDIKLSSKYEAQIVNVYPQPGKLPNQEKTPYEKALLLKNMQNGKQFWTFYNNSDLSTLQIFQTKNGNKTSLSFESLQENAIVSVEETRDILNSKTLSVNITTK